MVLLLGIGSFVHGFDEGVEFKGGRSYTVKFDKAPNIENVREDLKTVFNEFPIIKTVNTSDQLNITTSYKITEIGRMLIQLLKQPCSAAFKISSGRNEF